MMLRTGTTPSAVVGSSAAASPQAVSLASFRGNHLSNTTRLTHAFFKVMNNAANSIAVLDK